MDHPAPQRRGDHATTVADEKADVVAACREQLVWEQWSRLRALEALPQRAAGELIERDAGQTRRVEITPLAPLTPWEGLAPEHVTAYQRLNNQTRIRRLLDYVLPGDRVLDIGCGFGYVPGLLLRETQLERYYGLDIGQHRVRAAWNMLAANGFDQSRAHFEVRSLFDIDREYVESIDPTLIVVCEVLEHIPDPLAATKLLAEVMRPGVDLLFSVPMGGRLEMVAGHRAFFNADRLIALCQAAGLTASYVEPIFNTWTYVLAGRGPCAAARLVQLSTSARAPTPAPLFDPAQLNEPLTAKRAARDAQQRAERARQRAPEPRAVCDEVRVSRWRYRTHSVDIAQDGCGVRCSIVGSSDQTGGQYGGVCFPTDAFDALRLDLELLEPASVEAVYVMGYAPDASDPAVQWRWKVTATPTPRRRFLLVPGQDSDPFEVRPPTDAGAVRDVHVFVRIRPGSQCSFILHEAVVVKVGREETRVGAA